MFVKIKVAESVLGDKDVYTKLMEDFGGNFELEETESNIILVCGDNRIIEVDGIDWDFIYSYDKDDKLLLTYFERGKDYHFLHKSLFELMENSGKRTWTGAEINEAIKDINDSGKIWEPIKEEEV